MNVETHAVLGIALTLIISAGLVFLMVKLSEWLGPKKPNPVKDEAFECGVPPTGPPPGKFSVKFYMVAMVFLIFDVEIMFLFPWAIHFKKFGLFG